MLRKFCFAVFVALLLAGLSAVALNIHSARGMSPQQATTYTLTVSVVNLNPDSHGGSGVTSPSGTTSQAAGTTVYVWATLGPYASSPGWHLAYWVENGQTIPTDSDTIPNPLDVTMDTDIVLTAYFGYIPHGISGVGGILVPINKLTLLAPLLASYAPSIGFALAAIITAAVATALCVNRVKHRREKQ
jgi:hypothetical protein